MKLVIKIDIDIKESGLDEKFIKDNIIDFTRDLLINGAAEEEIGITLNEVDYSA